MERIKFSLAGGLSADQMEAAHEAVLRVLSEIGLECDDERTVGAVTADGGVEFRQGRLKFSREVVNSTIQQLREAGKKRTVPDRLRITAPWTCYNVIDMQSGEVRGSTAADLTKMLKLVASFYTSGPPPVCPCDLDPRLQILWAEKTCLEMAPGFGGGIVSLDPDIIHWVGELHAVAGRRYDLALQTVISPLRLDRLALDLFWRFNNHQSVIASINTSPIPVGGISAPLFPSGLLVQGVAEQLGGIIVSKRLGCAGPDTVLTQTEMDCGDMRYLTTAHSLPDTLMVALLQQDLVEYFSGYRPANMCLCTNSKTADAFAASDRMAYLLMLGLAGFRHFAYGAGQLSMDEVFSPVQFVIDQEIGRYVQQVLDGAKWHEDREAMLQCIAEGVKEGNFLSHPSTLDALPDLFDSPIFRRDNVNQWRSAGSPGVEQLALERAKAAIASFVPAADAVPKAELDRVFEQACRALGLDSASQSVLAR